MCVSVLGAEVLVCALHRVELKCCSVSSGGALHSSDSAVVAGWQLVVTSRRRCRPLEVHVLGGQQIRSDWGVSGSHRTVVTWERNTDILYFVGALKIKSDNLIKYIQQSVTFVHKCFTYKSAHSSHTL